MLIDAALVTLKFKGWEVPPPGGGFVTTTGYVPTAARSDAASGIVSWFAFLKVAVCEYPLNDTVEGVGAPRNPTPLIVRVCAAEPTVNEEGNKDVIDGAAFGLMQFPATTCSVTALLAKREFEFMSCAKKTSVRGATPQVGVSCQVFGGTVEFKAIKLDARDGDETFPVTSC